MLTLRFSVLYGIVTCKTLTDWSRITEVESYDQQMHNYLTNYHTATCFDTIVSYSDSL